MKRVMEIARRNYRDLDGQGPFAKVVSAGIFEHVGRTRQAAYFSNAWRPLKPDRADRAAAPATGSAAEHVIPATARMGILALERRSCDWRPVQQTEKRVKNMKHRILVSYASGSGSTGEVAEFIGDALKGPDVAVDVQEASVVGALNEYDAVVLGSSIRFGRWLPNALAFLERFSKEMRARPAALFMTCLSIIDRSAENWENALAYWDPILQRFPEINPVGLGLFSGSIAREYAQLPEYQGSPLGDYRDWDSIRAWAGEIRAALLEEKQTDVESLMLAGTVLSYTDLSGADLSRIDFRGSEFVQANLQRARLRQADLQRARMEAADMRGADLRRAQLGWAEMPQALCQEADFSRASLIGVNLSGANLQRAKLVHAVLNGATLSQANIQGADLANADLNWADLSGSSLAGANLRQASLGWANLRGADLSGANLEGARYNANTQWPDNFSPQQAGCTMVRLT